MDAYDTVRATKPVLSSLTIFQLGTLEEAEIVLKAMMNKLKLSLKALAYVLVELSKLLAPVMPFISETIYRDLIGNESVHLAS